jgi:hypothetical protein
VCCITSTGDNSYLGDYQTAKVSEVNIRFLRVSSCINSSFLKDSRISEQLLIVTTYTKISGKNL